MYGRGASPIAPAAQQQRPGYYQDGPLEQSGSLTGHILAQGHRDGPTPKSRTAKVVIVMVLVLAFLIGIGVLGAMFATDTLNNLLGGLIEKN